MGVRNLNLSDYSFSQNLYRLLWVFISSVYNVFKSQKKKLIKNIHVKSKWISGVMKIKKNYTSCFLTKNTYKLLNHVIF